MQEHWYASASEAACNRKAFQNLFGIQVVQSRCTIQPRICICMLRALCAFTINECPMAICCRRSQESINKIQERSIDFKFQDPVVREHRKYEPGIEAAVEQLYCSVSSHLDYHLGLLVDTHGDISKALHAWWPDLQSASQSGEVRLSWPLLQKWHGSQIFNCPCQPHWHQHPALRFKIHAPSST